MYGLVREVLSKIARMYFIQFLILNTNFVFTMLFR